MCQTCWWRSHNSRRALNCCCCRTARQPGLGRRGSVWVTPMYGTLTQTNTAKARASGTSGKVCSLLFLSSVIWVRRRSGSTCFVVLQHHPWALSTNSQCPNANVFPSTEAKRTNATHTSVALLQPSLQQSVGFDQEVWSQHLPSVLQRAIDRHRLHQGDAVATAALNPLAVYHCIVQY